ncbi:MAG: hypothetical protein IJR56_03205, partial [Bacteroidaceae bacterium]|nr:hypothetical protein [Bacteroidaceae bacterium]
MKKIFVMMMAMMAAVSVNAQQYVSDTPFTQGKMYASAGLSGLDLNYNSNTKWNLGIDGKAGYFLLDDVMALGEVQWGIHQEAPNDISVGVGMRYYIRQNGIFLGAGAKYKHHDCYDDFMPNVNVGYAFFLSRTVTIEPELYYNMSTKSFKDYSGFGLRIGFGIYLDELF